ncbi:alpha-glucan family phosphorylase [bacterium]|nr:alpha-glucan family phosphorylase [bacterium]
MKMTIDPVCGMHVHEDGAIWSEYEGKRFVFCSQFCKQTFLAMPSAYALSPASEAAREDLPRRVAYFSMEVAVEPGMATYSGGLGVLAGDTLRSAADLGLPVVAVSLRNSMGYFEQLLDSQGHQQERWSVWDLGKFTHRPLAQPGTNVEPPDGIEIEVSIEGRPVKVKGWQHDVVGVTGFTVPLILLDTDLPNNDPRDRELTSYLYGGDQRYRLAQEVVLGIGGVRMLRALGYHSINRFHMNEGHAALLVIELLETGNWPTWDFHGTRAECIFTTHTPVPAGHDSFPYDLVQQVLSSPLPEPVVRMLGGTDRLDMTHLGMSMSRYVNGVAKRHAEVSRNMFPGQPIGAITNGVHSWTWTSESFRELYNHRIPGWVNDPAALRSVVGIPTGEIRDAHVLAKARLIGEIERRTGQKLAHNVLTLGFARRATEYKRTDLVFRDIERLASLAREDGAIQLVFAGKAHPRDEGGKEAIRRVFAAADRLRGRLAVVYLENYDLPLAGLLTAGVDVWLNTPRRPLEASGTSGMKAAHNGVPSLSTLDGWWIEGHVEGVTGWSIGSADTTSDPDTDAKDAEDLYRKLRDAVLPLYYRNPAGWLEMMRNTIALNGSFFNTHRMVQQYATNAYL